MDASFWMRVYKNLQLTDPRESTHNFARTPRLMSTAQGRTTSMIETDSRSCGRYIPGLFLSSDDGCH